MRITWIGLFFLCLGSMSGASFEPSFLQSSQTTEDPGTQPSATRPPPGVLGIPGMPVVTGGGQTGAQDAVNPFGQTPQPQPNVPTPPERPATAPRTARQPIPNRPTVARMDSRPQGGVEMSFTNAPIDQVVSSVMKELGYSYVIDPGVSGSVNLYTQGEIPRDKLFSVLEQLLKMNGQAIVRQDDFYVILPIGASPKVPGSILIRPNEEPRKRPVEETPSTTPPQEPPVGQEPAEPGEGTEGAPVASPEAAPPNAQEGETAQPPSEPEAPRTTVLTIERYSDERLKEEQGVVTYIIPLLYIPSAEMVKMVQAFVSDGAQVVDFQPANMLILTDYRASIEQALTLIHLLDTRYFDINTLDLIPIRYNQAVDVAEDLGKIFAPNDQAGGVRIVAIERLNSILVVTHVPQVLEDVKDWITKLDAPSSGSTMKTFVYYVENNVAGNIAEILGQLFQDSDSLPSGGFGEGQEGIPQTMRQQQQAGFLPETGGSTFGRMRAQQFGSQSLGPSLSGYTARDSIRSAVVTDNIKVIVSALDNSLIIHATEADYQFLLQTIKQLDVLPRQALIEAKIYAVELRDDLSFGVAAFLQGVQADAGPATTGSISAPGEGSAGGALSVATRLSIGLERQLDLLINALRSKTNVEILEAPTLLVIDGTEAQINVGAEVPVTTASFGDPILGGSTSFVNSIQFRPTGTTLLISPRISASGIVTMEVAVEVSSATGAALTPTINRNYVRTSLIAQDNQTVAIAGVISDHFDTSRDRVPVLGDIPILGALFGQTSRQKRRFELIFLITPKVIRNIRSAAEMTLEFKRGLQNAYEFIENKEQEDRDLRDKRRSEEAKPTGETGTVP